MNDVRNTEASTQPKGYVTVEYNQRQAATSGGRRTNFIDRDRNDFIFGL